MNEDNKWIGGNKMKKFILYVLVVTMMISPLRVNNPIKVKIHNFQNQTHRLR